MSVRVQVILQKIERERFRRKAAEQGLSLSAWLRQAGSEKAASEDSREKMTVADLRAFFRKCAERERGREPDWEQHRIVIDQSRSAGQSGT